MKNHWIAIDWGTSNFRAFLMKEHQCLDTVSAPCGLLHVPDRQFAAALKPLIGHWLTAFPQLPLLMAGMVGSQQGWQEVPYVTLPAGSRQLAQCTASLETPWGSPCQIVAGVSGMNEFGLPDVMRGEEVQLIGLAALHPDPQNSQYVILPGTHSKHAELHNGEIRQFSTFMTGEIYSVMLSHSMLGRDVPESPEDTRAFALGVTHAQRAPHLSNALFSARTLRLNGVLTPAQVASYLSGLLIGAELHAVARTEAWVVGSPALTERYTRAAKQLGITLTSADGNACFIQGMTQIYQCFHGESS